MNERPDHDDAIRQERYREYADSIERRISHALIEREACLLGHDWLCARSLDEGRSELREAFAAFRALQPGLAAFVLDRNHNGKSPEAGERTSRNREPPE